MQSKFDNFQLTQLTIYFAILFIAIAIYEFKKNEKLAVGLVFICGLGLRVFMASLDPYLNWWDEVFHALVAKNLAINPLNPTLYQTPFISTDYKDWTHALVWVHKQPLFMWQMALSIKIFGCNEFAVRLPSIIMGSILALMVFSAGKKLVNTSVGFYASVFYITCYSILDMVSGYIQTEHNDIAFMFYISASIWAYINYLEKKSNKWIILIGVFIGAAVLNKWLTGLLLYSGWTVVALFEKGMKQKLNELFRLLKSFTIAALVFLPWQIYILIKHPKEAKFEFEYNSLHFTEVLEGHNGNEWFHLDVIENIYGKVFVYILPLAVWLLIKKIKNRKTALAIFTIIAVNYLFFTIAKTKMPSFTVNICMVMFIAIGCLYDELIESLKRIAITPKFMIVKTISLLLLFFFSLLNINFHQITSVHASNSDNNQNAAFRNIRINQKKMILNLDGIIPDKNYILFNMNFLVNISTMFYTNYTAYDFLPTIDNIKQFEKQKQKIAVFNYGSLPEYIKESEYLKIIDFPYAKEIFRSKILLKTTNGKYLDVDSLNSNVLKMTSVKPKKNYTIVKYSGNKCTFIHQNGKYISTNLNDGQLVYANRDAMQEWELHDFNYSDKNVLIIKASNNKYWQLTQDGFIKASAENNSDALKILIIPVN